jgi:hypothetical protein
MALGDVETRLKASQSVRVRPGPNTALGLSGRVRWIEPQGEARKVANILLSTDM